MTARQIFRGTRRCGMALGLTALLLAPGCARSGPAEEHAAEDPAREELTPAERIALWRAQSPGEPLHASLAFTRPLRFAETRELLRRYDLRPYAVHLRVAGLAGAPWVRPEEASMALVDRAREQALEMVLHTLCERGGVESRLRSGGLAGPDSAAYARLLRAMLTRVELSRRSLAELQADSPVVIGVKALGPVASVEGAMSDPRVARVEPGVRIPIRGVERVVVPDPAPPAPPSAPETIPWIEALEPAEVRQRLLRALDEQPEECLAWSRRQEELRRSRHPPPDTAGSAPR